jgi:hypothetical protein
LQQPLFAFQDDGYWLVRVHDLLVRAGPLPELPDALTQPGALEACCQSERGGDAYLGQDTR